jgi:HNH endonuclease
MRTIKNRLPESLLERIEFIPPCSCWLWSGAIDAGGYARLFFQGKKRFAHRLSYEYFVGKIPDGMVSDHLCRNTWCVNPAHIEIVTQKENVLRGFAPTAVNSRKTCCIRGHEFTAENTIRTKRGRVCRTCQSAWRKTDRDKRKQLTYT